MTALHIAASRGDVAMVLLLFDRRPEIADAVNEVVAFYCGRAAWGDIPALSCSATSLRRGST